MYEGISNKRSFFYDVWPSIHTQTDLKSLKMTLLENFNKTLLYIQENQESSFVSDIYLYNFISYLTVDTKQV